MRFMMAYPWRLCFQGGSIPQWAHRKNGSFWNDDFEKIEVPDQWMGRRRPCAGQKPLEQRAELEAIRKSVSQPQTAGESALERLTRLSAKAPA
jgi:hypothetical protein